MPSNFKTLDSLTLYITAHSSLFHQPILPHSLPPHPPPSCLPHPKLIPGTCFVVDGFKFAAEFSVSYFLSHFHSDHYVGLSPNWSKGIIFYSPITSRLLVKVLHVPAQFVFPLPLSEPVLIDGCEVALIDANHCPGAVQFLFKVPVGDSGKFERYIHTGDFRYCDAMKLDPLLNQYLGADAVFLDTTYCNPKFVFPDQEESIDYVVGVIERIGVENELCSKRVLFLVATYVIGKERILLEIFRRCKRKIHVDARKMEILRVLGYTESGAFTVDEAESDIHVVGWNVLGETWPYFRPNFVRMNEIMNERGYSRVVGFVPTGWTYEVKRNKFSVRTKDSFEIHLVPYSEHSNYDELRQYVKFLRPKRVIPTVGEDVEKLDSKHVNAMRKHFSGLVDETANKQDFLLGFFRGSQKAGEESEKNCVFPPNTVLEQEDQGSGSGPKCDEDIDLENVVNPSFSLEEHDRQSSYVAEVADLEECVQELQDCLPGWVTRSQMVDLVGRFDNNVVASVSYFYEHEIEFSEQVKASAPLTGLTLLSEKGSPVAAEQKQTYLASTPVKSVSGSVNSLLSQNNKLSNTEHSKSSIPPSTRKRNRENNSSQQHRSSSNRGSNGPKQYTITKFFSKRVPDGSQDGNRDALLQHCHNDDKSKLLRETVGTYKEKVDQFLKIVNGEESLRNYAATLLEKTKGDVNMALDVYFKDSSTNDKKEKSGPSGLFVQSECSMEISSSSCDVEVSDKVGNDGDVSLPGSSTDNILANSVSLPPDKYSPIVHACWKNGQAAPYLHLARTFDLVEDEKGKIKATLMLCNMFRSLLALSPDDVLPAVYLCTNKIAPDHENMELNIGGSIVVSALEEACGTNKSKIQELYNKIGDLGDVAQICRQTQSLLAPPVALTIRAVFSALQKISVQTGTGSTARKKSLIVNLMRSCREKEMKFLVRTLVRNLRIGAMMRTVLPALAQAVVLNSLIQAESQKEHVQCLSSAVLEAYNILPNLDFVIPSLMKEGIKFSSRTLSMVPGIPIKPMLAKITNGVLQVLKLFQNKAFSCEYKYDGQRAQIHRLPDGSIRVFSRNGDETTSRFPDVVHIINEICGPTTGTFILDSEVVAIDRKNGSKLMSFQELSSRERGGKNAQVAADKIKVDICLFVFDVMFVNGEKLLDFPLRQRRKYFEDLFGVEKPGYFEYAREMTVEADDASIDNEATVTRVNGFLEDALSSYCEGIMVKSLDVDAGYTPSKRSDAWLKVKRDYVEGLGDSLDLVPIGAWHGNGRKAGWFSPFLMACFNPDTEEFQSVCRVMSGFSDAFYKEMKEFFSGDKLLAKKPPYYRTAEVADMWFSPELVWEIRGADFTVSPVHHAALGLVHPSRGISIRFPRFVRTVSDRKPEECSTASDIADMFHSQTRKMDVNKEVKQ